ncbi:MAG: response regulator transcription factor [Gammaproteobacteria bacterium]|nr:response regulator transcription factor [Gammaproteobacteria bacterium]
MRILLIEDDPDVADYIKKGLIQENHIVEHFIDGKEGLISATTETYDVMIIDRMLPHVEGLTIVRTLRASSILTPILILSALTDVNQRVEGLQSGANDYLIKPFAFSELLARITILAQSQIQQSAKTQLQVGDLTLDLLSHKVMRENQEINVQTTEYRLLEYLMRNKNQVLSRVMLFEHVWDYHFDPKTNVIDVHMSRLRKKVDKPFKTVLIHTVRGAGYVIKDS